MPTTSLHLVLYQPQIPHNTGAVGRLCLALDATLHLIKPIGFSLEDKYLLRAGLDYWKEIRVQLWENWEHFTQHLPQNHQLTYIECGASNSLWNHTFSSATHHHFLVYGPETGSLPETLLQNNTTNWITIPMHGTRSLNLATAVAITAYEAQRQTNPKTFDQPTQ
jgi:tRNA (cytidine/uridine-2'-O-)-methyltransferase